MRKKGLWKKQLLIFNVVMMMMLLPFGQVIAIHVESEESPEAHSNDELVLKDDVFHFNGIPQENGTADFSQFEEIENDWPYEGAEISTELIEARELTIEQNDVEEFVNEAEGFDPAVVESGQLGTIPWTVDASGTLTLGSGIFDEENNVGGRYEAKDYFNHSSANQQMINSIVITGRIELRGSLIGTRNSVLSNAEQGEHNQGFFENLPNVQTIEGMEYLDTSQVTNMERMFTQMRNLREIDVSHFDTRNVTNMNSLFYRMESLVKLDLSSFDTSNVTDMTWMFGFMGNLQELDISHFDTQNVLEMNNMFSYMRNLVELDVTNFDTSNVTSMTGMFLGMNELTEIDVTNFNTSNVISMGGLFMFMPKLKEVDVTHFDTRNVTRMDYMFFDNRSLRELDLSSFDTGNVTTMHWMFSQTALEQLTLGEAFSFHSNASLPGLSETATHHANWQNIGQGTATKPEGEFIFTSAALMANYDGRTMADTWVWQPRTFLLTIESEGAGNGTPENPTRLLIGETLEISAIPDAGWRFSHWRIEHGDGTIDQVNDATTIFTMGIEEARIVAAFEELEPLMTVRLPLSAVFSTTASSNHEEIISPEYDIHNESPFNIYVNVVTATDLNKMEIVNELNVLGEGQASPLIREGAPVAQENRLFEVGTEAWNTFTFTGTANRLPADIMQVEPNFTMVLRFIPNP